MRGRVPECKPGTFQGVRHVTDSTATARLADRLAIQEILHSHCRGLDRNDEATVAACYWPGAQVDYGNFQGPARQFAQLIGPALGEAYQLTRHCISNTLIAFDGSLARVESYVEASHLLADGASEMRFGGRYLDKLEKRGEQWRLLFRRVVMDWSHTRSITDERQSDAFVAMSKGRNDGGDPLYDFLREDSDHG
jgi:hypothetical protein